MAEHTYNSREMASFMSETIKGIVNMVNENNITRDRVVTIFKDREGYILIYYK